MGGQGTIFDIREFCVHDGPGVRTTVFFKGCPLRCLWCHNPEGLEFGPELLELNRECLHCGLCRKVCPSLDKCQGCGACTAVCPAGRRKLAGTAWTAEKLAAHLLRDRAVYEHSGGGVTFSGGEPLAQPDFLFEVMERLQGIHLTVETSGFAAEKVYCEMLRHVSLVIQDIKHANPERHLALTGQDNQPILRNLAILKKSGRPFIVRIPLIPGLNDDDGNLEQCAELLRGAENLLNVQLLPYNQAAPAKYASCHREFKLKLDMAAANRNPLKAFQNLPCQLL